ncbi:MAG: histidinol-phosphate transaminase [Planctomycetes bacterium]|nr:histidinol-phosphate transaminase [Planctomycetota bacterium]
MGYYRDNIEAMSGYAPGEQPQGGRFIKLNTNENPYPPSPRVMEAVHTASEDALRKYPDPMANAVRDAVANMIGVGPENVVCGNGSDDLLRMIFTATLGPGDTVTVTDPTYSLYETLAEIQDAQLDRLPCQDDFALPVTQLAASTSPLVVVANPNAPTGLAAPIEQIGRIAREIRGLLLVDEAYADFADENAMALAVSEPNVLVMRTLSKSYSLAGLRFGYAVGSAEVIAGLMKVKDSYNCDALAIAAARAALDDQTWMRQNVERIKAERSRLIRELRNLAFTVLDSRTNFVMAGPPDGNGERLYQKLKERGILVRYFNRPRIKRFVRITVGTREEMDALIAAVKSLI